MLALFWGLGWGYPDVTALFWFRRCRTSLLYGYHIVYRLPYFLNAFAMQHLHPSQPPFSFPTLSPLLPLPLLLTTPLLPTPQHLQMSHLLRQRPFRLPSQPGCIFLAASSQPRLSPLKIMRARGRGPTLVILFCFTRFFFLGAMVRAPFLGLADFLDEEGVGLRDFMVPWAMAGAVDVYRRRRIYIER